MSEAGKKSAGSAPGLRPETDRTRGLSGAPAGRCSCNGGRKSRRAGLKGEGVPCGQRTQAPSEKPEREEAPSKAGVALLSRGSGPGAGGRGRGGARSPGPRRRRLPAGGHTTPREREAPNPHHCPPAADSNTDGWRARPISARPGAGRTGRRRLHFRGRSTLGAGSRRNRGSSSLRRGRGGLLAGGR